MQKSKPMRPNRVTNRSDRSDRSKGSVTPEHERAIREDLVTQAALEAYGSIRHEGRMADRALDYALRAKSHLYAKERRAVAERVYSLLRRQRTVDALLDSLASNMDRISSGRLDALRLATSRLLEGERLERVLTGAGLIASDGELLKGLPQAVKQLSEGPNTPERFGMRASLPDFVAKRFMAEFGEEADRAAQAMNTRAPLFARVNTLKTDREALVAALKEEGVRARMTDLSPLGLDLETRINAFALNAFQSGLFEIQDEGSQLLGMLVDPPPTKVVDACAGAGGKTLQLAAEMKNRGELFALDVDEGRLEELKKRARRDGVHNVRVRVIPEGGAELDAAIADLKDKADRVMVDAPCSGSGTFRRKPDARYRMTPEGLTEHAQRQRRLLEQFSPMVKPGGRLIYGTCSLFREENEQVVESFLAAHADFEVMPLVRILGETLAPQVASPDGRFLRLAPHRHGTDGFFGAVLARKRS